MLTPTTRTASAPFCAHTVDRRVGVNLRLIRKSRGLSQGALAEAVGITFQQVQKYEKGDNRVSASKLFQLAAVLNVPVSTFFEGYGQEVVRPPTNGAASDSFVRLVDTLPESHRRLILSVARALSGDQEATS